MAVTGIEQDEQPVSGKIIARSKEDMGNDPILLAELSGLPLSAYPEIDSRDARALREVARALIAGASIRVSIGSCSAMPGA